MPLPTSGLLAAALADGQLAATKTTMFTVTAPSLRASITVLNAGGSAETVKFYVNRGTTDRQIAQFTLNAGEQARFVTGQLRSGHIFKASTTNASAVDYDAVEADPREESGLKVAASDGGAKIAQFTTTAPSGAELDGNVITPTALGAGANNYDPTGWANSRTVRLDGGVADRTITGLAAPSPAAEVRRRIINIGTTNSLIFAHASGSSDAANRITCPNALSLTLLPGQGSDFQYDVAGAVWRPVAGPQVGLADIAPATLDATVAKVSATDAVIGAVDVIFRKAIADAASGNASIVTTHKIRVIDVWLVKTGGAGHASEDTVVVGNGANAITDAIAVGDADKAVKRASTIDDAYWEIDAAGSIRFTWVKGSGGGNNPACTVFVRAIRVA